jgi:hypothetical protein
MRFLAPSVLVEMFMSSVAGGICAGAEKLKSKSKKVRTTPEKAIKNPPPA